MSIEHVQLLAQRGDSELEPLRWWTFADAELDHLVAISELAVYGVDALLGREAPSLYADPAADRDTLLRVRDVLVQLRADAIRSFGVEVPDAESVRPS